MVDNNKKYHCSDCGRDNVVKGEATFKCTDCHTEKSTDTHMECGGCGLNITSTTQGLCTDCNSNSR